MECNYILGWVFNPGFDYVPYNIADGNVSLICKKERDDRKAEIWYNATEERYTLNCHANDTGDVSLSFDKEDAVLGRMIYFGDMFIKDADWRKQSTENDRYDCYSMERSE